MSGQSQSQSQSRSPSPSRSRGLSQSRSRCPTHGESRSQRLSIGRRWRRMRAESGLRSHLEAQTNSRRSASASRSFSISLQRRREVRTTADPAFRDRFSELTCVLSRVGRERAVAEAVTLTQQRDFFQESTREALRLVEELRKSRPG